jgi:hypothetical protein
VWWQTINRDRPIAPTPITPPPPPPAPKPTPAKRAAPAAQPPQPAGRSPRRWWIPAAAAAVVVIGGSAVGLSLSGPPAATRVLDITAAQRGVEQILRDPIDGYGAETVTRVVCNDGLNPAVKKDNGFSCDAVVDGVPRRVAVVFQDENGTYAVDRPR